MKRLVSLALMAMFGLAMVGCHADIEPNDNPNADTHYKKTTTYNRDGSVTTETKSSTNTNP